MVGEGARCGCQWPAMDDVHAGAGVADVGCVASLTHIAALGSVGAALWAIALMA